MSKLPRTVFRPLDGILLLDKPPGMSSNQALQRVRHLFRAEKAGHTGSLDPLATGLLPVCFGEATKIAGHLLGNGKSYSTTARLGLTTDTDDADGTPLRERPIPDLSAAEVLPLLERFVGRVMQRPPIYSALKQGGEPLYAKARRGEQIDIPERAVVIDSVELLALRTDELDLRITCGSGTYIRSIVRDLGELLGCGAHVLTLRRSWVDPFRDPAMYTLDALQAIHGSEGEGALDACLLPLEAGLSAWPCVRLDGPQALALGRGQAVQLSPGEEHLQVKIIGPEGRSLGLGMVSEAGELRSTRLFRWAVSG